MPSYDPWAGESDIDPYDPHDTKVFLASSNKQDHSSVTPRINVPKGTLGEIGRLVSEHAELRTVQDFYRDSIARGIMYWRSRKSEASEWGLRALAMMEAENFAERINYERDLLARYEKLVAESSDLPMTRQEILIQIRALMGMVESEGIRARMEAILRAHPIFTDDLTSS